MRNTLFEEFCTPVSVVVMVALADDDDEEDYHGYLNDDEKNIMILQVTRVLQLRRKWLGCWSGCKKCRWAPVSAPAPVPEPASPAPAPAPAPAPYLQLTAGRERLEWSSGSEGINSDLRCIASKIVMK